MESLRRYSVPLFLTGLCLLAIGLPFSKFLMSVSQFFLAAGWILEGNFKKRLNIFMLNRTALLVSAVFFLHLIGLIYSDNLAYGLDDVRKKIPLFLLPFLLVTAPSIPKGSIKAILGLFLTTVTVASILVVFKISHDPYLNDVRQASSFISHIRFSLMVAFSSFISIWLGIITQKKYRILFFVLPVWFLFVLSLMQAMTGLLVLGATGFIAAVYFMLKSHSRIFHYLSLAMLTGLLVSGFLFVANLNEEIRILSTVKIPEVKGFSDGGEKYAHYPNQTMTENGHLVFVNIAWKELERAWNQRSEINFSERDLGGNEVKYTLLRFLTSRGMTKDSAAVYNLSRPEIDAIQSGIANTEYLTSSPLDLRMKILLYELDNYLRKGDPNGHSLTMRIEFAKAGAGIWKDDFWFGVGTGDVADYFKGQYDKMNSQLEDRWRLRAHNQFLEIGVALGLFGLLIFLASLIYPLFKASQYSTFLYITFFTITFLSMFGDDNLETQAGVTFYAFFNALLLFGKESGRLPVTKKRDVGQRKPAIKKEQEVAA